MDMRRLARRVLGLVAAAMVLTAASMPAATATPTRARQATWTRFHFDNANTGYNPRETVLSPATVGSLVPKWTARLADLPAYIRSSPAVVNGRVYLGLCCVSYSNSSLVALDAKNGAVLWSEVQSGAMYPFDPTVSHGTVYLGTLYAHQLYAYDASTGSQRWVFQASGAVHDPVVIGRRLFVSSNSGAVYALDAGTGAMIWQASVHNFSSPFSVAVAYGMVLVGSDDTNLYAFDARTGTEVWHTGTGSQVFSSATAGNGLVYVGAHDGAVKAYDVHTGASVWSTPVGFGVDMTPVLTGGMVYATDAANVVYALDAATGALRWSHAMADGVRPEASAANGVLYVASGSTEALALDAATGAVLWSFQAGDVVFQEPVVVNGVLYVASDDGNLYAFSLPGG